jgi:hypothetical protein
MRSNIESNFAEEKEFDLAIGICILILILVLCK